MNDLISRQQAIDELEAWIDALDPDSRFYRSDVSLLNRCIRDLKKLPSAQPEQKWIPVKDPAAELPKNKWLWVTHESEYDFRWVDTMGWDKTEWSDRISNVVAYMPYEEPEPYVGEGKQ